MEKYLSIQLLHWKRPALLAAHAYMYLSTKKPTVHTNVTSTNILFTRDCDKVSELTNSDSILKSSIIKQIGRELAQGRVHTILHLQTNGADSKNHQTFKQRLGQTSTRQDENEPGRFRTM